VLDDDVGDLSLVARGEDGAGAECALEVSGVAGGERVLSYLLVAAWCFV
jgi:hypothetical protein